MRPSSAVCVAVPRGTRAKLPRFYRNRVAQRAKLPQQLALTGKNGNKEYYKGTGQAYVPGAGGSARTGPPGYWQPRTGARGRAGETTDVYKIDDTKVRVYVGPGMAQLDAKNSSLKPYVDATELPPLRTLVGFRPPDQPYTLYPSRIPPSKRPWAPNKLEHFRDPGNMRRDHPDASHQFIWDIYDRPRPLTIYQLPVHAVPAFSPVCPPEWDRASWSRWYRGLEHEQRLALIMKQRKDWWNGLQQLLHHQRPADPEEDEHTLKLRLQDEKDRAMMREADVDTAYEGEEAREELVAGKADEVPLPIMGRAWRMRLRSTG